MFLKILIFKLLCCAAVQSAKILAIFPVTLTGDAMGVHIMNELTARNHQVTVLNLFSTETYYGHMTAKNYTEITLDKTWKTFIDLMDDDYSKDYHEGPFSSVIYANIKAYKLTEELLSDSNFQMIINSKKFDIVIMEYYLNDAALGVGPYLGIPTILLSSKPSSFHDNHLFANPAPVAYVPHGLTGYTGVMSFWQRVNNLFYNSFSSFFRKFFMFSKHERLLKEYISSNLNLRDVLESVDLLLVNSHPVVTVPVPLFPNMIEIGGYNIKEKPLPEKIQQYMDKATKGIIIFSLRFNFGISQTDYDLLQTMARAFQMLEQQVVWHFDGGIQIELPNKVEFYRYLNSETTDAPTVSSRLFSLYDNDDKYTYEDIQHGLLAHPNTKAFFSQGELNDLMEGVYFGVPVVGIPINREQKGHIEEAVERGYAVSIPYEGVTETNIVNALNDIIENPEYTIKAKEASRYMTNQIAKPMDLAMHWIEFVIRERGAKNLQSPGVKLEWYKRKMIDIVIILTIIDVILFIIFYYIFKHIIRCLFRKIKQLKCAKCKKYSELKNDQT